MGGRQKQTEKTDAKEKETPPTKKMSVSGAFRKFFLPQGGGEMQLAAGNRENTVQVRGCFVEVHYESIVS